MLSLPTKLFEIENYHNFYKKESKSNSIYYLPINF